MKSPSLENSSALAHGSGELFLLWQVSPWWCGERLFVHEEEFQGGEGTANFVLLSDSAETNMCSTNNGVGVIIRARNCQRVSKYGKEWGDPECPVQGSALCPQMCRARC